MKFRFTPKYWRDLARLNEREKKAVYDSRTSIAAALNGDVENYKKHRLKEMEGYPRIWEGHVKDDLVFTFHYDYDNGIKVCYFRRIGTHKIYKNP